MSDQQITQHPALLLDSIVFAALREADHPRCPHCCSYVLILQSYDGELVGQCMKCRKPWQPDELFPLMEADDTAEQEI